jgi:DNA endonuclease
MVTVAKPLRPVWERDVLYHEVLELRSMGLSYNKIIAEIERTRGVRLNKSHIHGWVTGKHRPFGDVRPFDASPTPELCYVIGVKMGDASTSLTGRYNHKVKLRVKDKDFAEEFSRCLGILLKRDPPRVKWHAKTATWHTELSSVLLRRFLLQSVKELEKTVSHCESCKGAFLRGFFDSEGSISERSLKVTNGDLEKLTLVESLLSQLGIRTTAPHLDSKGGRLVVIKGKFYTQNKDMYHLSVRAFSLRKYKELVGFSIVRKAVRLAEALGQSP